MKLLYFVILSALLGCNSSKELDPIIEKESTYFDAIEKNDVKLNAPRKGEWLFDHKEKLQTFEKYEAQKPKTISETENTIYLKPIGDFTALQLKALELTRQYLSIFYQTNTILLDSSSDSIIPEYAKRLREKNNIQLLAPYVLDSLLIKDVPKNSIAFMVFTAKDLYPKSNWNFVFGLASYAKRVGVTSVYRFQNSLLDSTNFTTSLKRLINVSSHEIGHMFTIHHCVSAKCVINGSSSLYETDLSPNRLCSECQKKLFWNIRYNNKKRLTELCEFFKANNLLDDYRVLSRDYRAVK